MTPLEFVTAAGDNYNDPVGIVMEALKRPIRIYSGPKQQWVILSYYLDLKTKQMVLDIEKKK